jgi:hypothetical protein
VLSSGGHSVVIQWSFGGHSVVKRQISNFLTLWLSVTFESAENLCGTLCKEKIKNLHGENPEEHRETQRVPSVENFVTFEVLAFAYFVVKKNLATG